ncbi:hypothetical protein V6N11_006921 [Hibiscus sabdariffa]|uniref:Uncharacterized protein n=1 Tax=Hibiscus sabdariffa TaxID=183260 RepID=A0ABR2RS60_9ROSI
MELNKEKLQTLIETAWALHDRLNREIDNSFSFCRHCSDHGRYCDIGQTPFEERKRLIAIRDSLKDVENTLLHFQKLQAWQLTDRHSVLSRLEQSRLFLIKQVTQYEGRPLDVVKVLSVCFGNDDNKTSVDSDEEGSVKKNEGRISITGSGYSQSENQQNQSYRVAHTDHSQRMERPAQVFNHTVGSITPNSNNGYVLSSQNGGFSQPSHVQPYSALSHTSPVYTPHVMGNQFSPGQFTSGHFTSGDVMNFPPGTSLPIESGRQSPVAPAGVSQPVLSYSHDGDLASPLQRVGDTPVGVSIPLPTVSADSQQPMATFSHDGDLASPLQRVGDTSVGVSIPLPTVSAHSQQPMATSSHDGDLAAVTSPIASQRSDNVAGEFVTTLNLDAGSSETHFPELCGETQRLDTSITHLRTRLQPEPTDFLEDEVQNEQVNEEFPVLNFPVEHVGRIANSSSQNSRQVETLVHLFYDELALYYNLDSENSFP